MSFLAKKTAQKFLADPKSVDLSKYTKVSWEVRCYYLREILPIWRKKVKDDLKRSALKSPHEWINQRIVIGRPPSNTLTGRNCSRVDARKVSWWLPKNVCDWFWKNLEDAHKGKYARISWEAADLLNRKAIFWFGMLELDASHDKKAQIKTIDNAQIHKQLAKIKKIIGAKNSDNFAMAVELVRTLELDNEDTWLSMLTKTKVKQISSLSVKNTRLLLEIAAKGTTIRLLVLHNLALAGANLTSLTEDEASILACRSWLDLSGLKSLSDMVAQALSHQKGTLYLNGLVTLSDLAAQEFGQHEGSLYLNGLTNLNNSAAESLAQHKGLLGLNGCLELSDHAASRLARHVGRLELSGLERLSKRAVHEFAQYKKSPLLGSASLQEALKVASVNLSNK